MQALRTAATGMAAQQLNVEVISNNIANMNTVGFKRQRAEFEDLLYQTLERAGAQSSDAGTVVPTGVQVGGGVKAGFKLEMGLLTDNGANGVPGSNNNVAIVPPGGALRFDRAAYVSLSSRLGEVRLGRDLVASFVNDVVYDPFLTYGVGSSLNFPLGVLGSLYNSGTYALSPAVTLRPKGPVPVRAIPRRG